ncbi:hypothetical protein MSAN_01645900 [Mycena sanguinolenta]|uniref:Uncharacterized protein n=1 Tax=Mycena sanguinolenta TaxID=230812 RepID=A0A8H6Y2N6_9AGAR|nr:hypothetical protein MSAN_01645900 [Mycena sanguinolenta]
MRWKNDNVHGVLLGGSAWTPCIKEARSSSLFLVLFTAKRILSYLSHPASQMFSKLLALGLGALAVVHAAPAFSFQTPLLSCSVNLDASVAPVQSLDVRQYWIYNAAFERRPLRVFAPHEDVSVGPEVPGEFARWLITPGKPGSNEYTFTNVGAYADIKVEKGMLHSTTVGQGDNFVISPAGEGMFTIQVPNEDKVWTVTPGGSASNVFLRPARGGSDSRWILERAFD